MSKLIETTKVDYEFMTCKDFFTGEILVKLVKYTKVGNHPTKAEYAKPAKLEWVELLEGEACEFFLSIPIHEPSELEQAKETEVSYWLRRALRFFVSKTKKRETKELVLEL